MSPSYGYKVANGQYTFDSFQIDDGTHQHSRDSWFSLQTWKYVSLGRIERSRRTGWIKVASAEMKLSGDVAITGAGIQGLAGTIYAAKRGLNVTIYEREEKIGGQLNEISDPFKKKAFAPLLEYYENALKFLSLFPTSLTDCFQHPIVIS